MGCVRGFEFNVRFWAGANGETEEEAMQNLKRILVNSMGFPHGIFYYFKKRKRN